MMSGIYDYLEALLFRAFLTASALLSVERASAMGSLIFRTFAPRSRRHRKVRRNLRIAFPERDEAWIERTAVAMWGQFGRSFAEIAHLQRLCAKGRGARLEVVARFDVEAVLRQARPMIFVSAHQANWNLPAALGHHLGIPLSVLYRRRRNPHLEAALARWRDRMPCGFIDVGDGAPKAMLAELRKGHSLGLYIDRRARREEPLPFFGIATPTPTIAARLAIKTGACLVPARIERLPDVRFRMTLHEPVTRESSIVDDREAARAMTLAVHRHFEAWIRERPEQWFCTSMRWPRGTVPPLDQAAIANC